MSRGDRPTRLRIVATMAIVTVSILVVPGAYAEDPSGTSQPSTSPAPTPAHEVRGSITLPTSSARGVRCPDALTNGVSAWVVQGVTPGRVFALRADDATYRNDFDIQFYPSLDACVAGEAPLPHRNHAGDENAVVPPAATIGIVTLTSGSPASFTYRELADDKARPTGGKPRATVVAVIEPTAGAAGYNPYHSDFLGSHHPWNTDGDPDNDLDFTVDPANYIDGFPAATPVHLTLPTSDDDVLADLAAKDGPKWTTEMKGYTDATPNLYWLPGTKVVAMAEFHGGGSMLGTTTSHATKAASVAAGNIHGTCPECVFVLLGGSPHEALRWAVKQPWVDVITNSWLRTDTSPLDITAFAGDVAMTRDAVEGGKTIVWGAGNGTVNLMGDTPSSPYTSSQRGPDWIVTAGAVVTETDQPFRGSGKPADIAAYGDSYPSAGGTTRNGESVFSGTSNAAPVVAGTFAQVIQSARELVNDKAGSRGKGELARGPKRPCVRSPFPCPLDDGVLTRAELQSVVFDNVLPATADVTSPSAEPGLPMVPGGQVTNLNPNGTVRSGFAPPADFMPAAVGHGIVYGRFDDARFVAEQRRLHDALRGAVEPYPRPPGERAWLAADSKCRQRLWGTWSGGYSNPSNDPPSYGPDDAVGAAWDAMCSALPQDTLLKLRELVPSNGVGI